MTNWDIFNILNYLINKSETGNSFAPSKFEQQINYASLLLFKRRLGMPEEYQRGIYVPQQGYAPTTRLLVDLSDFLVVRDGDLNSNMKFVSGKTELPTDLAYPVGMTYRMPVNGCGNQGVDHREVELVNEGEYKMRKNSALKPITTKFPVCRIIIDQILIHPEEIGYTDFTYLKFPTDAVFATTTNGETDELEYDASASTELEWNDLAKLDIISIVLGNTGLNLRANEVRQAARELKITGI